MTGPRKRLAPRYVPAQCDDRDVIPPEGRFMTPDQFAAIRRLAGLSCDQLAQKLRIRQTRTIRRYEDGTEPVSGPVSILMEQIAEGLVNV